MFHEINLELNQLNIASKLSDSFGLLDIKWGYDGTLEIIRKPYIMFSEKGKSFSINETIEVL